MRKLFLLLAVCVLAACTHNKKPEFVSLSDPPEYYVYPFQYEAIDEDYDISGQSSERIRLFVQLGGFTAGPTYFVDVRRQNFADDREHYQVIAKMPPDLNWDGRNLYAGAVKHYSAKITENEFDELRQAFDVLMSAPHSSKEFMCFHCLTMRIDSSGIDGAHARDQFASSQNFEHDAEFARHMFAVAEAHIPETAGWGKAFRANAGLSEK